MIWKLSITKLGISYCYVSSEACSLSSMACVEEKCVVMDNTDEDPISSLTMFLKDWEVQGLVEIIALSSQWSDIALFYEA